MGDVVDEEEEEEEEELGDNGALVKEELDDAEEGEQLSKSSYSH